VSHSSPAAPFFSQKDSSILDFYNGELNPAFEKISESDLTFAMYYAPWDAESQAVRAEFELLASYYSNEVWINDINRSSCYNIYHDSRLCLLLSTAGTPLEIVDDIFQKCTTSLC
jgi:hypothetical protein